MSDGIPAPRTNLTASGFSDRAADVCTSATIKVAAGDYTGGAADDLFTLADHGLKTYDMLHVLWQSAMGGVTGGEGTRCFAKVLSSSTFQVTNHAGTVIENSADATVVFLAGVVDQSLVEVGVIPNLIVDAWDFTGGSPEDKGTPAQGTKGLYEGDRLKLLYKSDPGVAGVAVDATVYAKAPTVTYHQISATNGGAVIDSTADGTAVFLRTS